MVKDIKEIEFRVQDVGEARKWAEEFMQLIFSRSQENLIDNRTSDTGFLLRSGVPPYWDDDTIRLDYDCPYALFVEYGTQPHPMSGEHLVAWVRRKLGLKDPKATRVAWAIAMKIKKEGTDPHPFLRPAINDAIATYNLDIKPMNIEKK